MKKSMVDKKYLQIRYGMSLSTINRRLDEFKVEIVHHRYSATALIRNGVVRVNPDAFEHFLAEREKLKSHKKKGNTEFQSEKRINTNSKMYQKKRDRRVARMNKFINEIC